MSRRLGHLLTWGVIGWGKQPQPGSSDASVQRMTQPGSLKKNSLAARKQNHVCRIRKSYDVGDEGLYIKKYRSRCDLQLSSLEFLHLRSLRC
jgi:hypothetical protein